MEYSKPYDSFQHELEDYIRKQKARGLQPKICFRKVTEDSPCRERGHPRSKPLMLEQKLSFSRLHKFPSSYKRLRMVENQFPPQSKIHESRQRLGSLNHCQRKQHRYFKYLWLPSPAVQGKNSGPYRAQPREGARCLSWENHTSAHHVGHKDGCQRRRCRQEEGGCMEEEQVVQMWKQHVDGGAHKENRGSSRKKAKVDPDHAEKHKRRRNNQNGDTTKERRRAHGKKGPGKESTEERDLWDEAILGSSY